VQKAEREDESGNPAEAMALREEHWAGSTWATTPEKRAMTATTITLRLIILMLLDVWNNVLPEVHRERINNWVWEGMRSTSYMEFLLNDNVSRDNSNYSHGQKMRFDLYP
jgi:hypothetical protein